MTERLARIFAETYRHDDWLHRWRAVLVDEHGKPLRFPPRDEPWHTPPCFTRLGALVRARLKAARLRARSREEV